MGLIVVIHEKNIRKFSGYFFFVIEIKDKADTFDIVYIIEWCMQKSHQKKSKVALQLLAKTTIYTTAISLWMQYYHGGNGID